MWAAGSKPGRQPARKSGRQPHAGLTLLELLVVVAIIALATAGVGLALRDSGQAQLEQEAQRLSALLETARAQSQATGVPVRWRPTPQGFAWEGLPSTHASTRLPTQWLNAQTSATVVNALPGQATKAASTDTSSSLLLGPEPLIAPQAVRLQDRQSGASWVLSTDGVRAFQVRARNLAQP